MQKRKRDHGAWYCLSCGTRQSYLIESDIEKIRRERDAAVQREETLRKQRAQLEDQRDHLRRRVSAANGQITKIKNRISKGVCPFCDITFENLQRHMASKHANYAVTATDEGKS